MQLFKPSFSFLYSPWILSIDDWRSTNSRFSNVLDRNVSENVILGAAASQSPRNLLELQIQGSHSRPPGSTTEVGSRNLCFSRCWCTRMCGHWCSNSSFTVLMSKVCPALRKRQSTKAHSQELKQKGSLLEVMQNFLHRRIHARSQNTRKIEEGLATPSALGVIFTLNDNSIMFIRVLKTTKFKNEGFGQVLINEWMNRVRFNYLYRWMWRWWKVTTLKQYICYLKYFQLFYL